MPTIPSQVDTRSAEFGANADGALRVVWWGICAALAERIRLGGGGGITRAAYRTWQVAAARPG